MEKSGEIKEKISFLARFFQERKRVASITPTSQIAARRIVDMLDISRPVTIIEYGPGTGSVASEIRARMSPTSRLLLVEIDEIFVRQLQEKFRDDERVIVVHGDIQNIETIIKEAHIEMVDAVLASIPLSLLSPEDTEKIIAKTHNILKKEGIFLVFNFVQKVFPRIEAQFAQTQRKIIWSNIPPLSVLIAKK